MLLLKELVLDYFSFAIVAHITTRKKTLITFLARVILLTKYGLSFVTLVESNRLMDKLDKEL